MAKAKANQLTRVLQWVVGGALLTLAHLGAGKGTAAYLGVCLGNRIGVEGFVLDVRKL